MYDVNYLDYWMLSIKFSNIFVIFFKMLKDHKFNKLAKGPGGCVLKMASFADVQNCFYTNTVAGS